MKVHRYFLWFKLSECIKTIFSDFHPKIEGMEESFDRLKFVVTFEKKVILIINKQSYKITIEIKPAVCELISIDNINLFKQYFEDFLRIKYDSSFKQEKRKQQKMIELEWIFTLDLIPE